jgi:acetyl esterase/lipase
MDVFAPQEAKGIGVIWVVSGRSGVERIDRPSTQTCFKTLLDRGYTLFAVVHGSAPRYTLPEMAADIQRAVRFVRYKADEFQINGGRLGIAGVSAGGTLALLLGTSGQQGGGDQADPVERVSSKVQAVGCFFGPADWLDFDGQGTDVRTFQQKEYGAIDPSFAFSELDSDAQVYHVITDEQRILRLLQEYSLLAHVTPDDAPTLLIHSEVDPFIPVQQAQRMAQAFTQAQVDTQPVVRQGKGHRWKDWEQDVRLLADWFDRHLQP